MDVSIKAVSSEGLVVSIGVVPVPRALAEKHGAVPGEERIARAKSRLISLGMGGVNCLIEVLQSLETKETVIGYLGFTLDRERLLQKPSDETETENKRQDVAMQLSHHQLGTRHGTTTAMSVLVELSEHKKLETKSPEERARITRIFEEVGLMLSRGSANGEA